MVESLPGNALRDILESAEETFGTFTQCLVEGRMPATFLEHALYFKSVIGLQQVLVAVLEQTRG